ncbi:MAG: hypothetical protein IJU84_09195 [Clostridia bacterium]|nr:hypothetical protein [Clostridia bacterium]
MKLQEIDKKFVVNETIREDGLKRYRIPNKNFALYGVDYDERRGCFMRMDGEIAQCVSDGVAWLSQHTSGGRLRFSTDSDVFEITVKYDELWKMSHMALEGSAGFMLVEEYEDGTAGFYKMLPPDWDDNTGYTITVNLPTGKMRYYTLWFPLYNGVSELIIGLNANANVGDGRKYRDIKPILYYGNSITQGGCASRPDNSYQSFISKWNNVDFINLGFSGCGRAEDAMVDYLTKIDCSLFVCDYDNNAPDAEYLERTHYRLYERYRKTRKGVPILFISAMTDAIEIEKRVTRFNIIKNTYKKAKVSGDKNVYLLDGRKILGEKNRAYFTVDGAHPTDLGFYIIAKKIYEKIISIDKRFKGDF